MKEFDLTEAESGEIQLLNAKLISVKNLIKESSDNEALFSRLMDQLAKTQIDYDGWFDKMQTKFNVTTNPSQRWNVDFKARKLQLLG